MNHSFCKSENDVISKFFEVLLQKTLDFFFQGILYLNSIENLILFNLKFFDIFRKFDNKNLSMQLNLGRSRQR